MKECGQEMKVILTVHGRERTFSEQELRPILKRHFSKIATKQRYCYSRTEQLTEAKWFEVNPLAIDQTLFQEVRPSLKQETTRNRILEAFVEVSEHPEKYASPFYTMIPKKTWDGGKTVAELEEYAKDLGGQMADWVEQALEWAQMISNGVSWENLKNDDTAKWYRVVKGWKGGVLLFFGNPPDLLPASAVCEVRYDMKIFDTVPLVVIKKKAVLSMDSL